GHARGRDNPALVGRRHLCQRRQSRRHRHRTPEVHRRPENPGRAPQVRGAGSGNPVFLAASPLAEGIGGRYFEDVNEADTRTESPGMFGTGVADYALEPRYAELLWEVSAEMVAAEKCSRANVT